MRASSSPRRTAVLAALFALAAAFAAPLSADASAPPAFLQISDQNINDAQR